MNRILEFNYNNVKYYLDYDNKFICSKEIDGIISYNLSDEEKILIQKALEESINVEDLV